MSCLIKREAVKIEVTSNVSDDGTEERNSAVASHQNVSQHFVILHIHLKHYNERRLGDFMNQVNTFALL